MPSLCSVAQSHPRHGNNMCEITRHTCRVFFALTPLKANDGGTCKVTLKMTHAPTLKFLRVAHIYFPTRGMILAVPISGGPCPAPGTLAESRHQPLRGLRFSIFHFLFSGVAAQTKAPRRKFQVISRAI